MEVLHLDAGRIIPVEAGIRMLVPWRGCPRAAPARIVPVQKALVLHLFRTQKGVRRRSSSTCESAFAYWTELVR
jgi:hypothetical protein